MPYRALSFQAVEPANIFLAVKLPLLKEVACPRCRRSTYHRTGEAAPQPNPSVRSASTAETENYENRR